MSMVEETVNREPEGGDVANKETERGTEGRGTTNREAASNWQVSHHNSGSGNSKSVNVDLWEEAGGLSLDYAERKRSMGVIQEEIARKNIRYAPSFRELFAIELQYISPFFWLMQGILVIGLLRLFSIIPNQEHHFVDYMGWVSVAAAWMGVIACSDLSRHISRGMAELEQSCYFNLPQMWTMRMILTGIVDILLLAFCSGRIAETVSAPFARVCVYVLVPFVLSNGCCLQLFSFMRGGRGRYGQLAMAFLAGIIAMIPSITPSWYQIEFWGIWLGVLVAGVLLLLWQIWILYGKMVRGEILCWN